MFLIVHVFSGLLIQLHVQELHVVLTLVPTLVHPIIIFTALATVGAPALIVEQPMLGIAVLIIILVRKLRARPMAKRARIPLVIVLHPPALCIGGQAVRHINPSLLP